MCTVPGTLCRRRCVDGESKSLGVADSRKGGLDALNAEGLRRAVYKNIPGAIRQYNSTQQRNVDGIYPRISSPNNNNELIHN